MATFGDVPFASISGLGSNPELLPVDLTREAPAMDSTNESTGPWYRGITRYQWMVLVICSLGWTFDVFEGQLLPSSVAWLPWLS